MTESRIRKDWVEYLGMTHGSLLKINIYHWQLQIDAHATDSHEDPEYRNNHHS